MFGHVLNCYKLLLSDWVHDNVEVFQGSLSNSVLDITSVSLYSTQRDLGFLQGHNVFG